MPYHDTMEQLQGDLYVRKATLEYLGSARYDEKLSVGIACKRIGNSSLLFAAASTYPSHWSLIIPFTVGTAMPSISFASAPNVRMPATAKVNS